MVLDFFSMGGIDLCLSWEGVKKHQNVFYLFTKKNEKNLIVDIFLDWLYPLY